MLPSSFSKWLRSNSENYLMRDAQARMAHSSGLPAPKSIRGIKDALWMLLFVPIYRRLPWAIRSKAMHMLPGSHRREWPRKTWRNTDH